MNLADYYSSVLVPSNVAVSALRRAGLPINADRVRATIKGWDTKLADLEALVEGEAQKRGLALRYSAVHGLAPQRLAEFLFSSRGLGLETYKLTAGGKTGQNPKPSTDDDALSPFASVRVPRPDDHPVVGAILKIRSLAKSKSTYAEAFLATQRADGCCHPKFNWTLRTARLSAENPPVHQIPEHADPEVAREIKSFIVPRVAPAREPQEWDPRRHGSCFRWDIDGAEGAIRAAMLTHRFCSRPDPAWSYIREGRDIHSHTAGVIYRVPDTTYRKGSWQRDVVAKQTFFAAIFGAEWGTIQATIWERARLWLSDDETKQAVAAFWAAHPGLAELYERDKAELGEHGYCQDGYGRRRWVGLPAGVRYGGWAGPGHETSWTFDQAADQRAARGSLKNRWHIMANTPTQSMNATDCLWMLALCLHGEYRELRVPPCWEAGGIPFPEARGWRLHEGPGPGGKPLRAWHTNTVHDSGWGDCAPGHLEPAAKLLWRRCRALPFDWRLEADVPYRVSISVGPDMGHLEGYNAVAKRVNLEPLPER